MTSEGGKVKSKGKGQTDVQSSTSLEASHATRAK